MKKIVAVTLASFISTPVLAGSLAEPVVEPVIAPVTVAPVVGNDWSGFYAGGQLGYGDVSGPEDLGGSGAIGGAHIGYNHDFGGWVLGGELDANAANIGLGGGVDFDRLMHAKLRLGADMGNTLLYVAGGVAYADIGDMSDRGYFGGVGLDYDLGNSWIVGGEVLYHEFKDFDGNDGLNFDATTLNAKVSFRF